MLCSGGEYQQSQYVYQTAEASQENEHLATKEPDIILTSVETSVNLDGKFWLSFSQGLVTKMQCSFCHILSQVIWKVLALVKFQSTKYHEILVNKIESKFSWLKPNRFKMWRTVQMFLKTVFHFIINWHPKCRLAWLQSPILNCSLDAC